MTTTEAQIVALFNHKGGVSKTTTAFNLGWKLAERGNKVLLVDADPQCNLTGLILGYNETSDVEGYYGDGDLISDTIYTSLLPAIESQPREIEACDVIQVEGRPGLHLMPGDIRLAEHENSLGIAQELSGAIQALKNLPGSLNFLLRKTAAAIEADYVIVDMSPGLGPVNQNLTCISDFLIIPAAPDFFSVMALESLSRVLVQWRDWASRAAALDVLKTAAYKFPEPKLKVLGTIVQKYRPRNGAPAASFRKWIEELDKMVEAKLVPALRAAQLLPADDVLSAGDVDLRDMNLAQIAEFNSLIAKSQEHQTPVFALTEDQLGVGGAVADNWEASRDSFDVLFDSLAAKVEIMCETGAGTGAK